MDKNKVCDRIERATSGSVEKSQDTKPGCRLAAVPRHVSGLSYLCAMRKLSMQELGRPSADEFRRGPKIPVVVILDNIRSMHNVGSVFRTADAFALEGIDLCGYTPRPPHRDIQKTALGATETVPWHYFPDTAEAVQWRKSQGYRIIAVEQTTGSRPLQEAAWNGLEPLALVFGNEVEGVQEAVLTLCESSWEIPQYGTKHSLNISVAAGIVLWELIRGQADQAPESP